MYLTQILADTVSTITCINVLGYLQVICKQANTQNTANNSIV